MWKSFLCINDNTLIMAITPDPLKLNKSRQGIQRADQAIYHVLTRCARYSATSLKPLSTIEPGTVITAKTLEQFFLINQAQIQYLQDEYASILVNSQFDTTTSELFFLHYKRTLLDLTLELWKYCDQWPPCQRRWNHRHTLHPDSIVHKTTEDSTGVDPAGVIEADQPRSIVSRAASSLPREDQKKVHQTKTFLIFNRVLNV